jgi:DNA repair exonuclease SbcCD ATPase subunit/DNA repair exonuclease SbcCD nuclease subunit
MTKIAHCADIHIRALSRHDEYRKTFETFIADCKDQGVDHIFVGGDIFHTKTTGISPEYIELLTWWLTEMSKVAPTHLILGNHDGNLVNMSRQDAVTPIVDAISNPRVHLYKQSGVYKIQEGMNFCVFSLFDEEGWKNVNPVQGEINIACYHGPVWGCKTESDWLIEDGVNVDFFEKYDFTLLGDIHKRQNLAYRQQKPIMSYPGTMIQQNYAEDFEHGYLIWDIKSRDDWDVSFRPLPNIKPFVTLEWTGDVEKTYKLASSYPKGSRFRVKSYTHIAQQEVHALSSLLKKTHQASEVTFKIDQLIDKQTISAGTQTLVRTDLREPDVLMKLIKDFHKTNKHPEEIWQSVGEQIKLYLSTATSTEDVIRNTKWMLRSMKFDNLFAYGEGNVINFENLNGIVGIFGSNRAGKSSIVGSMMYSLFNTTDRGPMKNLYVCNVRKPYCYSNVVLNVNGVDYVIERQTTKNESKKGVVSAATSLNVYKIAGDDVVVDLAGEQRSDTEKVIRGLIGNAEDFLMTSLSAQGEINQFIQHGSSKRRQILSRFLDLDVFDKMYDLANKDVNSSKAQLKSFPEKDWQALSLKYENEIERISQEINDHAITSHDLSDRLAELKSELSRHAGFTPVNENQVSVQRSKVESIEKMRVDTHTKCDFLREEIQKLAVKISTIESLKEENDISELKKKLDSLNTLEASVMSLKHAHEKEASLLTQQERSLKTLSEVPCGDNYPTCKFIKDAHAVKTKIDSQRASVGEALEKLNSASLALDVLKSEKLREKIEKLQKLHDMHSKLNVEVSSKKTELFKQETSLESINTSLVAAQQKLHELEEALKNEENAEVFSIKSEIQNILKTITTLDSQKMKLAGEKGKIISDLEKLESEKKLRDELLKKMKVHELVSNAFSKKGIPSVIVASQLPIINAEISKILAGIVDFTVDLEVDEDTESMDVYINYGDSRRIIELASGMEKMISSIAIRVALINVSSLPKTDMFIIDEGFGALDDAGVEACNRLLSSLKRYFKTVFVITHVDGVKDAADIVLEITKNEKDSKVVYD